MAYFGDLPARIGAATGFKCAAAVAEEAGSGGVTIAEACIAWLVSGTGGRIVVRNG